MSSTTKKTIAVIHYLHTDKPEYETVRLLSFEITLQHVSCQGDIGAMAAYIKTFDGQVDAMALVGVAGTLQLGTEHVDHEEADHLFSVAEQTPVVDGSGVQAAVERWGVYLADEQEPGIWTRKHLLMVPGLNHSGLIEGLTQFTGDIRYADPVVYFGLPGTLGIGSKESLGAVAERTLNQLQSFSFDDLFPQTVLAHDDEDVQPKADSLFGWADILAGDIGLICKYGPTDLNGKTILTSSLSSVDVANLAQRNASIVVSILPNLNPEAHYHAHHTAAELEACLRVMTNDVDDLSLPEQHYLQQLTDLKWQPTVQYLKPEEARLNRFAFVHQPLTNDLFQTVYPWTRWVPEVILDRVAPHVPPVFLGRLRNITSAMTDIQAEGILLTLGGTPNHFVGRDRDFVVRRLLQAAHLAERLDARLLGVSAYSALMGEGAEYVSHKTDIAITSGRNLNVAAALEAAVRAVGQIHQEPIKPRAVIFNANRSDAAACARYLAPLCDELTLVANRPEILSRLQKTIQAESPETIVRITNSVGSSLAQAQLLVSTLSDQEKPLGPQLDLTKCYPGTVICDLGRPPLLSRAAVNLRPDLLVIHGAEFRLPGSPTADIQLGVGPGTIPAALAEAALLALEGRFEDFSLDRTPDVIRWREIFDLGQTHGFELVGPRQFNVLIGASDYRVIRAAIEALQDKPDQVTALMKQPLPAAPPPPRRQPSSGTLIVSGLGVLAVAAGLIGWLWRSNRSKSSADSKD